MIVALWDGGRPAHPGLPGVPMSDALRDAPARMFLCAGCRAQVVVCSHCDRGQRYCAGGCAGRTRQRLQREAGRRYQRSRMGRHKHAQRMRRWRDQSRADANKVTHQGSQGTGANDVLAASQYCEPSCTSSSTCLATSLPTSLAAPLLMPVAARAVLTLAPWRCRFCGARVPPQLRPDFLRPGRGPEP